MSQIATLYIVKKANLSSDDFTSLAIEKIDYNWSGFAFIILSVYSNEIRTFDWEKLELNNVSQLLSEKTGTAITIFSTNDKQHVLSKLNPDDHSVDDLENFAIEFSGDEGLGTAVMEASKILFTTVNKIDNDNVLVLEIT